MMNKLFSIAALVLISLGTFAQSGQNTFYEVKAGDTKYGISRQYNISIERLEKYNPDIKNGLKVGITLLIPPPVENTSTKTPPTTTGADTVKHKVVTGDTRYSLSRTYGISILELEASNPFLKTEGLKVGQVLTIPVKEKEKETGTEEEIAAEVLQNYHVHKVKPQETAWSISQQYQLSLDSLYLLNPGAEDGLRIGQVMKLPKNRGKNKVEPKSPSDELATDKKEEGRKNASEPSDTSGGYLLYKIKTGDSFYALKQRYQVSREELIRLNPEVARGLEVEKYIIIPMDSGPSEDVSFFDKLFKQVEEAPTGTPSDQQVSRRDSLNTKGRMVKQPLPKIIEDTLDIDIYKNYKVAVMLPFHAVADTSFNYEGKVEQRSTYALDFYNGLLMAADSLAKEGMNLTLNVMDTEKSLFKMKELAPKLQRERYELVIGPMFKENVEYLARELSSDNIPVISPVDRRVEVKGQPNLIKCIPGATAHIGRIANLINTRYGQGHIIFLDYQGDGNKDEHQEIREIKARLKPRGEKQFIETITVNAENITGFNITNSLSDTEKNVVVVLSQDKVFLSTLVGKLRNSGSKQIYMVGPPELLEIPTLDLNYLNALNLTMVDVNHIQYGSRPAVDFIDSYRERFHNEPSKFAYQGYDVGMYFLRKLWKTGPFFLQAIEDDQTMLSTGFSIRKTEEGGYENNFMHVLGVRDFTLVKVE